MMRSLEEASTILTIVSTQPTRQTIADKVRDATTCNWRHEETSDVRQRAILCIVGAGLRLGACYQWVAAGAKVWPRRQRLDAAITYRLDVVSASCRRRPSTHRRIKRPVQLRGSLTSRLDLIAMLTRLLLLLALVGFTSAAVFNLTLNKHESFRERLIREQRWEGEICDAGEWV